MSAKAAVALGHRSVGSSPEIITAMAIFTSEKEPWSTKDTAMNASAFLDVTCQHQRGLVLERLLKEQIRPLFSKSKNPAITSEGRKNLHPVPLPRFDGSILDDSIKPWKNTNVYATSLLRWIVSQYATEAQQHLEAHFPLLVPAILALIDDSSIHFKIQGCEILGQLLESIQRSDSDILIRTNLISVFEDAITPCLLSLPSITPEENSLSLLGVAYPTLLSLFKAAYQTPHFTKSSSPKGKKDEEYTTRLVKVLRSNLVSSFHHVSSSTPASISTAASFPHPRLSAFLLDWIGIFVKELGIHTTKYLQDLVPVLYTTLTNPFGTVHPPLLFAAVSATKAVITNAHPRNPQPVSGGRIDPDQLAAKGGLMEELQQLANADPELEGLLFPERQPRV
ncbi:hypothetical protein N7512_008808 [Penicillium capsulatum]|nr:hypothetical protein N7512_008808 [Penicillium capsulatum]